MEWIHVDKELPEMKKNVLVSIGLNGMIVARRIPVEDKLNNREWKWLHHYGDWDALSTYMIGDIKYWMPLPNPPEIP